jgi:hypothetical protein
MMGLQTCKCTRLAPFGSYQSTLFKPESCGRRSAAQTIDDRELAIFAGGRSPAHSVAHRVRCPGHKGQSLRPNLIRDGGPIKTSFRKMWYWLGLWKSNHLIDAWPNLPPPLPARGEPTTWCPERIVIAALVLAFGLLVGAELAALTKPM